MANCYFAKPDGMQHFYIPFLYAIDFKGALSFERGTTSGSKPPASDTNSSKFPPLKPEVHEFQTSGWSATLT
jgi:hypothetical protein